MSLEIDWKEKTWELSFGPSRGSSTWAFQIWLILFDCFSLQLYSWFVDWSGSSSTYGLCVHVRVCLTAGGTKLSELVEMKWTDRNRSSSLNRTASPNFKELCLRKNIYPAQSSTHQSNSTAQHSTTRADGQLMHKWSTLQAHKLKNWESVKHSKHGERKEEEEKNIREKRKTPQNQRFCSAPPRHSSSESDQRQISSGCVNFFYQRHTVQSRKAISSSSSQEDPGLLVNSDQNKPNRQREEETKSPLHKKEKKESKGNQLSSLLLICFLISQAEHTEPRSEQILTEEKAKDTDEKSNRFSTQTHTYIHTQTNRAFFFTHTCTIGYTRHKHTSTFRFILKNSRATFVDAIDKT